MKKVIAVRLENGDWLTEYTQRNMFSTKDDVVNYIQSISDVVIHSRGKESIVASDEDAV